MDRTVPAGAANAAARDKYHVYRPLLDLIGLTEGTDKGRGYNETLAYGRLTGGPVDLVGMTLTQIDGLQTRMLKHPKNVWNSSAAGRYQIVRTTMRAIRKTLPDRYPGTRLYDADCQDEMACFLLGQRGIDKYLAGRMSEDTLMLNLAQEWASLPKPDGGGYYSGQRTGAKPEHVRAVLAVVRKRHAEGQPKIEVPVEKPVVPPAVEQEVESKTGRWSWLTGLIGSGGLGLGWLAGMDWQSILAGGVVIVVMLAIILLLRRQIVGAVKEIREGLA